MPSYDVFLSYNSQDRDAVTQIAEALQAAGLRPFLDAWFLPIGKPWDDELQAAQREGAWRSKRRSATGARWPSPSPDWRTC